MTPPSYPTPEPGSPTSTELSPQLLAPMVRTNLSTFDKYLPGITQVLGTDFAATDIIAGGVAD